MSELPRIPTPAMVAAAWRLIDHQKLATGISKLGPGLGVREIWQAMYDAAQGIEAGTATTVKQGVVHESPVTESDAPRESHDH